MTTNDLTKIKCKPCEGGIAPLRDEEIVDLMKKLKSEWKRAEKSIEREFKFKNFVQAMQFVNKVAEVAEEEGHHPDILIHYNIVKINLWTHAVNGLTENDFIVAA